MSAASEAGVDRFAELVAADPVPLGEAALVAASVLGHPAPVDDGLARLDELAAAVPGPDLASVTHHLCATVGLRGDETTYYDPANSLLPAVLDRKRGIPITLAVVTVDVARRRGVAASVVGMPGHVLVGDGDPPGRWVDVFHGGRWLDLAGARARFDALHGGRAPFDPRYLQATPDPFVLARLLANLVPIFRSNGDAHRLLRVRLLRATIAGVGEHERADLADTLASVGRYAEAAEVWQAEEDSPLGPRADEAGEEIVRLRAMLN